MERGGTSPTSLKELSKHAEAISRQILRMPMTNNEHEVDENNATGMSTEERNEELVKIIKSVEAEVAAYDDANVKAMEMYFRKMWNKFPFWGKRIKIESQKASEKEISASDCITTTATTTAATTSTNTLAENKHIHDNVVSAKTSTQQAEANMSHLSNLTERSATNINMHSGNECEGNANVAGRLHTTRSRTTSGHLVERTSLRDANDQSNLTSIHSKVSQQRNNNAHISHGNNNSSKVVNTKSGIADRPAEFRTSWLFKKRHPNWVPIMQRWWIPWLCVGTIVFIWTPDVWKLRALYLCDYQYAQLRQRIHIAYWRLTMKPEEFAELMDSINAGKSSSIKGTACPFE